MAIVTRPISIDWGITGLEGTDVLGYRVFSGDGIELIPRTTAGVIEYAPGQYVATITTWDTTWSGLIVWEDDTGTPEGTASEAFLPMDLPAGAVPTASAVAAAVMASTAADGVALSTLLTNINAAGKGNVAVTNNGDGTYTLAFKRENGTTTAFTKTFNPTTGTRT